MTTFCVPLVRIQECVFQTIVCRALARRESLLATYSNIKRLSGTTSCLVSNIFTLHTSKTSTMHTPYDATTTPTFTIVLLLTLAFAQIILFSYRRTIYPAYRSTRHSLQQGQGYMTATVYHQSLYTVAYFVPQSSLPLHMQYRIPGTAGLAGQKLHQFKSQALSFVARAW